jgi:cytochrome P450
MGAYWISRAADVAPLLKDPRCSHNPHTATSGIVARLAKTNDPDNTAQSDMFLVDAPLHARLRRPFQRALGQRDAGEQRAMIATIANELLDGLDNAKTFDVHALFATPLSVHVVAKIVGLGKIDVPALRVEVDDIGRLHDPFLDRRGRLAAIAARRALLARCAQLVQSRRENPKDDLPSQIIRNSDSTSQLTDNELAINVARFVVAGVQTTTSLICNTLIALLQHPEQLAKVRQNPDLAANAVEEALRFIPPFSVLPRLTKEPLEVGGCPVKAGQTLMLGIAAANRDPSLVDDGDRFDVSRPAFPHYSFGGGAHLCLGANLARMEAEIAVQQLLRRFPEVTLSAKYPVTWREQVGLTDLQALYIDTVT